MTTYRKIVVTVVAGLASAILINGACAQPAPQPGNVPQASEPGPRGPGYGPGFGPGMMGPGRMMGPGMMGSRYDRGEFRGMCNPRAAGMAEWRVDRLERVIDLNETQKLALNELRAASVKAADQIAQACPASFSASANERFAAMEKRMESMLQAVKTVRPAFEAFYGSLNESQRARLDRAGPRRWGWDRWH